MKARMVLFNAYSVVLAIVTKTHSRPYVLINGELGGIYAVDAYTRNTATCETEGPSALAEVMGGNFILEALDWFGTPLAQTCLCGDTVRAYEEVRRAIGFFHPKKRELEKIAPSLYTDRQRKRRKPSASVETPPVEAALPSESPAGAESHVATFAPPPRLLPAPSAPHPQSVLSDSRDT